MSGPDFIDVKKASETLLDAAAIARVRPTLTGRGEPVRLNGAAVSASFFDVLGVGPALGRTFRQDENEKGKTDVVLLALGAPGKTVVGLVVREAMLLAGGGVALGLCAGWFVGRTIRSLLFDTQPTDPLTFVGVATLLGVVALVACYVPARRATRVDPMVALRS